MLGQDQSRDARSIEVRQRHPGFTVSNEAAVTPGRPVRQREAVISPAVKQLNRDGYVVYNTPEKQDIYVTVQPDLAFFEDEAPEMVRMAGGSFVGSGRSSNSVEVHVRSEPEPEPSVYVQPADIFSNASRREAYGEIDFNEVIIKKNDSFEDEITRGPALFRPSFEENYEPVSEEAFMTDARQELAETSSETTAIEIPKDIPFMGYREVPEYEVEDTTEDEAEVPAEKEAVTDVPAGLYVDGYREINAANMDVKETSERSSFMETSIAAETAITSEAAASEAIFPEALIPEVLPLPSACYTRYLPAPREEESCRIVLEVASDTVTGVPVAVDIVDPVADIMKLTVPELRMSETLLSELSKDWEKEIPDDGLESYDSRFIPLKVPEKCIEASCAVSFSFEGDEAALRPNHAVNFRF
jgi:hypothetical protein